LDKLYVPTKVYFTKGVGIHKERLVSFEMALRSAGIERFNLVPVSSIFPEDAEIVTDEKYINDVKSGSVVFCVMSRIESNVKNHIVSASVGLAKCPDRYGYLSEHHEDVHRLVYDDLENKIGSVGKYTEKLAVEMLKSLNNITDDIYTHNATITSMIDDDDIWHTVVACAVLLP
jgi:arginine decarboxylase